MTTKQWMGLLATVAVLGIVGCGGGSGAEDRATLSSGGSGGTLNVDAVGSSSGGSMYPGGPCNSDCSETPTPLGLAEPSLLGFAPEDLLAVAEGSHEATLTDRPADDAAPTSAPTTLTLTIERTGSATFVEQFPVRQPDCGTCSSWVEVDVIVTLRTDDGTLDEQLPGVLSAVSLGQVTLTVPAPDADALPQTTLSAVFGPGVFAGWISWSADAGGAQRSAGWGHDGCDGAPRVDEEAAGTVSTDDLVAIMNDSSPVGVTWEDGAESEMTLSASSIDAGLCLLGHGTLWDEYRVVGSVLEAATTDGRLAITVPLDLRAVVRGEEKSLSVRHFGESLPIDTFTSTYGLPGLDFRDTTTARLTFGLNYPGLAAASGVYVEGFCDPAQPGLCASPDWQTLLTGDIDVTYSTR